MATAGFASPHVMWPGAGAEAGAPPKPAVEPLGKPDARAVDVASPTKAFQRQSVLLWGQEPIARGGRSASAASHAQSTLGNSSDDDLRETPEDFEMERKPAAAPQPEKLGTFKGVFLPCVQNILGVILFLRLPWITGQAGVLQASGIVLVCALSTFVTALSLSALATNGQVQAGGPYYVVSRNLGHEVGGAIGVMFYLGTTIAASMYVLGAVEAFETGFHVGGGMAGQTQVVSLLVCGALAMIVMVGVKYVNMSAQVFLAIVIFSIGCLLFGVFLCATGAYSGDPELPSDAFVVSGDNYAANWTEDDETGITPNFLWSVGLFYPSVTGIMAGANRSGVLLDAKRSIPLGTLGAIALTTGIYLAVVWSYGLSISREVLLEKKLIVTLVAWPHKTVVNLGIIMSCIGAGLQCMTGAPRLLSAVAQDGTVPFLAPFAAKNSREPVKAVLVTCFIAALPCLAGNLDLITPIITMFFLLMYATVNFSCFLITVLESPGWRPTWRFFSWHSGLFGFILCISLMLLISYTMAVVSICCVVLLFVYIRKQQVEKDWGDSIEGIRYQVARDQLVALSSRGTEFYHPKNWRPQLLVLCKLDGTGNPKKPELLTLAAMLKKGQGLLMTLAMVQGDVKTDYSTVEVYSELMRMHMKVGDVEGFPRVLMYEANLPTALLSAIQASGCGALRPNTVVLGWPNWGFQADAVGLPPASDAALTKKCDGFVGLLQSIVGCSKAVVVLKNGAQLEEYMAVGRPPAAAVIDVWWVVHDGGLLLLLPHLLRLHKAWKGCRLRIYSVINGDTERDGETVEQFVARITTFLNDVRISAELVPINISANSAFNAESSCGVPLSHIYHGIIESRGGGDIVEQVLEASYRPRAVTAGYDATGIGQAEQAPPMIDRDMDYQPVAPSAAPQQQQPGPSASVFQLADAFNAEMTKHSSRARLVVTNLPLMVEAVPSRTVVGFVERLTRGLGPTLLIRGSGSEVVTTFG